MSVSIKCCANDEDAMQSEVTDKSGTDGSGIAK